MPNFVNCKTLTFYNNFFGNFKCAPTGDIIISAKFLILILNLYHVFRWVYLSRCYTSLAKTIWPISIFIVHQRSTVLVVVVFIYKPKKTLLAFQPLDPPQMAYFVALLTYCFFRLLSPPPPPPSPLPFLQYTGIASLYSCPLILLPPPLYLS